MEAPSSWASTPRISAICEAAAAAPWPRTVFDLWPVAGSVRSSVHSYWAILS